MKENKKEETIETYNQSAKEFAERYDDIVGTRMSDIGETFALVREKNPKVLEIGCGSGKDAQEILKHTNRYTGFDASEAMVELAKKKNPEGTFVVADVEEYAFPKDIDIIFAFASLIHTEKKQLEKVFDAMYKALAPGGLVRLSFKYNEKYKEVTKRDEFGVRTSYLYSKEDIEEFPAQFMMLKGEINKAEGQEWLEVLLEKPHE